MRTVDFNYPKIQWFDYESFEPVDKPGANGGFMRVVIAPGMLWRPHHGVGPSTDQIDAQLGTRALDVWYVDGPDTADLRADYPLVVREANAAWEVGQVVCKRLWPSGGDQGIPSLLIPGEHFTEESLLEAFRRFQP